MTESKEFQGKSLDDAIQEACDYYGVAREKLEIEIVNDAKTGIFGLMGVKKATIRAARMRLSKSLIAAEEDEAPEQSPRRKPAPQGKKDRPEPAASPEPGNGRDKKADEPAPKGRPGQDRRERPAAPAPRPEPAPAAVRPPAPAPAEAEPFDAEESLPGEDLPALAIDSANEDAVLDTVCHVIRRLAAPIAGEVGCEAELRAGRVHVTVDSGEASGLLVGREGQTLAAIHYVAARIAARSLGGSVRLHIDAGNYRERQEDRLKELALNLAEKAKATGKSQSTRALSAYQRRIIHMALEEDKEVQTHSKGEGSQRRVVIHPRKGGERRPKAAPPSAPAAPEPDDE